MKMSTKVLVLSFLVFLLFASSLMAEFEVLEGGLKPAGDGRWKRFGKGGDEASPFYYNSESITKISDNVIQVWMKSDSPTIKVYDYTLFRIDCKKRMFVELEKYIYEKRMRENVQIEENINPSPETSWRGIKPESIVEDLYNIVCNKKN